MKNKIWLSSPHMGSKEQHFVKEAFDTNWVAPLGPNVDFFEKASAKSQACQGQRRFHPEQQPCIWH